MSAAKKQHASGGSKRSPQGVSWPPGPGRSLLFFCLIFGLFGGGAYLAWQRMQPRILASPENLLGVEHFAVTAPPPWIHSDVRADVVNRLKLNGDLSIMDDGLVDRVIRGFAAHPWVAKVVSAAKQTPPPLVKVELVYRRPVCVVKLPNDPLPYPVDADAVLLPRDEFTGQELQLQYLRLEGVNRAPSGLLVGQRWLDSAVIGGAEIAAALLDVWKELKLRSIRPIFANTPGKGGQDAGQGAGSAGTRPPSHALTDYEFELVSAGGTPIPWGYAPGSPRAAGGPTPAQYVARLKRYASDHGALDTPNHGVLDILRAVKP